MYARLNAGSSRKEKHCAMEEAPPKTVHRRRHQRTDFVIVREDKRDSPEVTSINPQKFVMKGRDKVESPSVRTVKQMTKTEIFIKA